MSIQRQISHLEQRIARNREWQLLLAQVRVVLLRKMQSGPSDAICARLELNEHTAATLETALMLQRVRLERLLLKLRRAATPGFNVRTSSKFGVLWARPPSALRASRGGSVHREFPSSTDARVESGQRARARL